MTGCAPHGRASRTNRRSAVGNQLRQVVGVDAALPAGSLRHPDTVGLALSATQIVEYGLFDYGRLGGQIVRFRSHDVSVPVIADRLDPKIFARNQSA
jgi:hypothetical protein